MVLRLFNYLTPSDSNDISGNGKDKNNVSHTTTIGGETTANTHDAIRSAPESSSS